MGTQNFQQKLGIIIDVMGLEASLKKLKKLYDLSVGDKGKVAKQMGLTTRQLPHAKRALEQKQAEKEITKTQMREGAHRASLINKEIKQRGSIINRLEVEGFSKEKLNKYNKLDIKSLQRKNIEIKKLTKQSRLFKMHWLGIMFAGMAVDRAMSQLIKGMIKDYKELTKGALTPLAKSLIGLEANWKFLKFSIMEMASPFLTKIVDWFANLTLWLSHSDPALLQGIAVGILALAAAGKTFMIGGQAALAFNSIKAFVSDTDLTKMKGVNKGLGTLSEKIKGFPTKAIGVAFAIESVVDVAKDFSQKKFISGIAEAVGGTAMLTAAFGGEKGIKAAKWMIGFSAGLTIISAVSGEIGVTEARKKIGENLLQLGIIMIAASGGTNAVGWVLTVSGLLLNFGDVIIEGAEKAKYKLEAANMRLMENMGIAPEGGWTEDQLYKMYGGKETGEKMAEDLITPSITASEDLVELIAEKGGEAFTVELKDAVYSFITDKEKGMAALQSTAEKLNETLGEDIYKTVHIRELRTTSLVSQINMDDIIRG